MLSADYSQLEMRMLASSSMEPTMIDVFARGWDVHMGNAAMMFGIPYEDILNAKDIDKLVKAEKLGPEALTDYMHSCLWARSAAKSIGFGQQ